MIKQIHGNFISAQLTEHRAKKEGKVCRLYKQKEVWIPEWKLEKETKVLYDKLLAFHPPDYPDRCKLLNVLLGVQHKRSFILGFEAGKTWAEETPPDEDKRKEKK